MKLAITAGIAGILLTSVVGAAVAAPMPESQQWIERVKVEDLLGRNGMAFAEKRDDPKKFEEWLDTFTADGEWVTQYERCKGREALRAYGSKGTCEGVPGGTVISARPRQQPAPPPAGGAPAAPAQPAQSGHLVSAAGAITFSDDKTANYKATWATINTTRGIVSVGHYDDTIVKVNGKWLIKQRQLAH